MMRREFSRSEKRLLFILALMLIALVYFYLVDRPVRTSIEDAVIRRQTAEDSIRINMAMKESRARMEAELAKAKNGMGPVPLMDYDNIVNVVSYLNGVMEGTKEYSLSFGNVEFTDYVAKRTINMDFTCHSYAGVKSIIEKLELCPYYCRIENFSMSVGRNGGRDMKTNETGATITVVFYEYVKEKES